MPDPGPALFTPPEMSERVFGRLSVFLTERLGIKLPPAKRVLLQTRVMKRLKALGLSSYEDYCDYLFSPRGQDEELAQLFDVATTNKTDFFREPVHFKILRERVLPELCAREEMSARRPLVVWSAGCSTGEEPYSIAMTLAEFGTDRPGFDFRVLASDISTRVLETARRAIYGEDAVGAVAAPLRARHLLRSRDRSRREVRIVPALRARVFFFRLNLMDEPLALPVRPDVVFCRNVIIYFDRETQRSLIRKIHHVTAPGGYLFSGHSETFCNMDVPFDQILPTVYRRRDGAAEGGD